MDSAVVHKVTQHRFRCFKVKMFKQIIAATLLKACMSMDKGLHDNFILDIYSHLTHRKLVIHRNL